MVEGRQFTKRKSQGAVVRDQDPVVARETSERPNVGRAVY
jgi:hypothetical protein